MGERDLFRKDRPLRFTRSFFGVIDLLAILPTYLSVIFPGAQSLAVIRSLRVLRIFRVLKLVHFLREIEELARAMRSSARKIFGRRRLAGCANVKRGLAGS